MEFIHSRRDSDNLFWRGLQQNMFDNQHFIINYFISLKHYTSLIQKNIYHLTTAIKNGTYFVDCY